MRKRSIVKRIFCAFALVLVFAALFVNSASAVIFEEGIGVASDSTVGHFLQQIANQTGYSTANISVWSSGDVKFYLYFIGDFRPTYIYCTQRYAVDDRTNALAGSYIPTTVLTFYDENFNRMSAKTFIQYWISENDGLISKGLSLTDDFYFGDYYPAMGCEQFYGIAVNDTEDSYPLCSLINVIKQSARTSSADGLYSPSYIDQLFASQTRTTDDDIVGSSSSDFSTILGYHWVSAEYYDLLSQQAVNYISNWNETASKLQSRISELENLNADSAKAFEQGKSAAYAEYNAVSGLLDGTVNAISSTVGYFFDNIKVGTVTLGAVVSLVVVICIIRRVK